MLKTFATREEVPAELQAGIIETKDGKFIVDEPEDRSSFDKALADERTKREAAEKNAKAAADALKKLERDKKAKDSGLESEVLERIKAEAKAEVMEELKADLEAGKSALAENRTLKLDVQVKALAGKHGVIGAELEHWWGLHGSKFDLTSDGKPVVKGKEGVTLEKFIGEDLKKTTPYFYEGTKAAGGGAAGITTGSGAGTSADDVLKNPGAALAAARAAGKTE
jgi:hypothetical protein